VSKIKLKEFKKRLLHEKRKAIIRSNGFWIASYDDVIEASLYSPITDLGNNVATEKEDKQLKEIDSALERIKIGQYGICNLCRDNIEEDLLLEHPTIRICETCKNKQNRE